MEKSLRTKYQREVARVTDLLVKEYKPEKIILFGSMAGGKLDEDSDIDLLVVKNTSKSYHQRIREVALMCASFVPKDIFVLTAKELNQAISEKRFLITQEILPKGKVLYEKGN